MGACFSNSPSGPVEGGVEVVSSDVVCKYDELKVGEIREVKVNSGGKDRTCILVKEPSGKIRALSGKCTHFGAPLAKGSYCDGKIRCPWHGACFNAATGDIEDFPGLDSLHVFRVDTAENGDVKIVGPKHSMEESKRIKQMGQKDPDSDAVAVVLGGGAAAQSAAETLRQNGLWHGKVLMLTKEKNPPYDRTKLSKALSSTAEELRLRNPAFYSEAEIEVRTNCEIVALHSKEKQLETKEGQKIRFDKLILCTGSSPRTMPEGEHFDNVHVLRTPEDGNAISAAARGKRAVIVGGSYIGMEVASFLADKAESVTVVVNGQRPFIRTLGPHVGRFLQELHEKKRRQIRLEHFR